MSTVTGRVRKRLVKKKNPSLSSYLVEEIFFRSWWVVVVFLLCHISYDLGLQHWHKEYSLLKDHLVKIKEEKITALSLKDDLHSQVNSQSDHAWIELTLMKGLGLVPEGQVKVFFKNTELE
jgi:hypothetical protein